jgi:hypothetical protein
MTAARIIEDAAIRYANGHAVDFSEVAEAVNAHMAVLPESHVHVAVPPVEAPADRSADECPLPAVDVDGRILDCGIELIGRATHVSGNLYRCLANYYGALAEVEIRIRGAAPSGAGETK